jgi:hypothetical protein
VILWRISNHVSLAGTRTTRVGQVAHPRPTDRASPQSSAAALLETLVHFEITVRSARPLPVLKLEAPDDLVVTGCRLGIFRRIGSSGPM